MKDDEKLPETVSLTIAIKKLKEFRAIGGPNVRIAGQIVEICRDKISSDAMEWLGTEERLEDMEWLEKEVDQ